MWYRATRSKGGELNNQPFPEHVDTETGEVLGPPTSPFHPLSRLMGFSRAFQAADQEFAINLSELVKLVDARGGQGSINMAVVVKRDEHGTVLVTFEQHLKPPKNAPANALAYVGDAGTLHKDDPYQISADEVGWNTGDVDAAGRPVTYNESGIAERPGDYTDDF